MLAVPALRALRAGARAPLALAAQPWLARLLVALDVADTALDLESLGLAALFDDDAQSVPRLPEAGRVVCWLGSRDPGFARRLRALAPGARVAPSVAEGRLVWEHLLETATDAAADAPGDAFGGWCDALAVSDILRADGARALAAAGWDGYRPLVIVHPGAGGLAKRWGTDGFAAVLDALDGRAAIVLHRGPADAAAVEALQARLRGAAGVLEEPALPTLAGALAHASLYVGNDSGPSHLAAALGLEAVLLYADRNLAWRPWRAAARVLVVETRAVLAADVERAIATVTSALAGRR